MEIRTFQVTPFVVNCFVVKDGNEVVIIDPGDAPASLFRYISGCTVRMIVNTHCHCDHCGGNAELIARTGAELAIHKEELPFLRAMEIQAQMFGTSVPPSPDPSRYLKEGDTVEVGNTSFKVVHAPGHSPGHIMLVGDGCVFSGDVLFQGSIGRTDLPGGDHHQLLESIRKKLLTLPDETVAYPGHGPFTTIGEERRTNPFLAGL
jgi:glyoxylase-like metal-dependent hydrolase (beta-lactamase superfamily II)